jgi:preprotein translocase subunit SecF
MFRILHGTHYDFIKYWKLAVWLTVAFIAVGAVVMAIRGPKYSIEFTGGTLMQVEFTRAPNPADVRSTLVKGGVHGAEIQEYGSNREFTIRAQDKVLVASQAAGAESISRDVERLLTERFGANAYRIVRSEAIGPRVGSELRRGAIYAVLASFLITLIYLAFRFDWRFGSAAIIATAHDTIATIAFMVMMDIEVSLTVIAAILTVIGYSLNDTIIIFDRVRENLHKKRRETLYETLNRSINETLPRTIMTNVTTLAATLALLFFGGEVIRPFAWIISFGIFTGTFSSVYVAGPILLWIESRWPRSLDDRERVSQQRAAAATPKSKSSQASGVAASSPARSR